MNEELSIPPMVVVVGECSPQNVTGPWGGGMRWVYEIVIKCFVEDVELTLVNSQGKPWDQTAQWTMQLNWVRNAGHRLEALGYTEDEAIALGKREIYALFGGKTK